MALPSILGFQAVKPQAAIGRNNLIFDRNFTGTVQTTTANPVDDPGGMPTNGWNTRTGDYLEGFQSWQSSTDYAISQETTIVKPGSTRSIKFDLRKTDPVVSSSVRTEIQPGYPYIGGVTDTQEMERWYGLSYYLKDWEVDGFGDSILQWHDTDGSAPPLSLQTYDLGGGVQHLILKRSIAGLNTEHDLGAITSNVWFEIVLHVKWAFTSANGILQCWKNGSQLVNLSSIKTNSNGGSYMKLGMNKWNWAPPYGPGDTTATQRIFYVDHPRIGNASATYNDVAPTQI